MFIESNTEIWKNKNHLDIPSFKLTVVADTYSVVGIVDAGDDTMLEEAYSVAAMVEVSIDSMIVVAGSLGSSIIFSFVFLSDVESIRYFSEKYH